MINPIADPEIWKPAACNKDYIDPETFFDPLLQDAALAICKSCPIRQLCLQYALQERITDGIWGGTTESQRRAMLKRPKKPIK